MRDHELRREYVRDQAVAAGKFSRSRAAYWRGEYDRDPAGTERTIASLASALTPDPPYPRELFPELSRPRTRRERATAPAPAAAAAVPPPPAPDVDEQVAAWSRELFPEAVAAGARPRRVTRAQD